MDELVARYNALFNLYVKHIHEHSLGVGDGRDCESCARIVNSQIEVEMRKQESEDGKGTHQAPIRFYVFR